MILGICLIEIFNLSFKYILFAVIMGNATKDPEENKAH